MRLMVRTFDVLETRSEPKGRVAALPRTPSGALLVPVGNGCRWAVGEVAIRAGGSVSLLLASPTPVPRHCPAGTGV